MAASTGTFYGRAMTSGDIYTIAGNGTAATAATAGRRPRPSWTTPKELAVDGSGNILIADTDDQRVRFIAASTGTYYGQVHDQGRHLHDRR